MAYKKLKESMENTTDQIADHFADYDVTLTPAFDLNKFAAGVCPDISKATTLLFNLEDTSVMQDIAVGNYSSFDMYDKNQFNDSYEDMMSDLGWGDNDGENVDFLESEAAIEEGINGMVDEGSDPWKFKPYSAKQLVSALNYVVNEIKEGHYDNDYTIVHDSGLIRDIAPEVLDEFNKELSDAYSDNDSEDSLEEDRQNLYFYCLGKLGIIEPNEEVDEATGIGLTQHPLEKPIPIYDSFEEYTNPDRIVVNLTDGRKFELVKKNLAGGDKAYQALLQIFGDNKTELIDKIVGKVVGDLEAKDSLITEQEGRVFGLNQRGHNLLTLIGNLPMSVIVSLKALQEDHVFEGNRSFTDTYLQDIKGGATPEELINANVIFKLKDNQTENIMENKNTKVEALIKKIEEATGKKVTLQEAEKVTTGSVGDLTVGQIIPEDSANVIQGYVAATLKELKGKVAELETIKFDISSEATASAEDWKQKTEGVQFLIKQLERVSRFVNNTILAKKFDKNILDKLMALTPAEDVASDMPVDLGVPMMDAGLPPVDDINALPPM